MKLWQVVYEEDGRTIKAPGISETEIKRRVLYYAADTVDEVWEATDYIRKDAERRFYSIAEIACDVTVLPSLRMGDKV